MHTHLLFLTLILFALSTFADCTDTDGGPILTYEPKPYIAQPGTVSRATENQSDYCMFETRGKPVKEGDYVHEYYCEAGLLRAKDYNCKDHGYAKCITVDKQSACVLAGQTSFGTTAQTTEDKKQETTKTEPKKPAPLAPQCGDKKLQTDRGEECDPPGKLCIASGGIGGQCTTSCTCQPYTSKAQTETGGAAATKQTTTQEPTEKTTETTKQTEQQEEKTETAPEPTTPKETPTLPGDTKTPTPPEGLIKKIWTWLNKVFS